MSTPTRWYKDAVIYELHVRAFNDANGDGIGDFAGLTQKLDYLQDLGVTAIWLLPFCPSPLKDDGYDIADFTDVHPAYGTLQDFKHVLREAHRRGLRVITELVLNHTSDQHPWFQRARRDKPDGRYRNFYVWSDTNERYAEARIIFKDFEASNWTRDPVAQAYYWHRFYSHQPDLNYDHAPVRKAMLQVVDFWFKLGVDGLRLDAVPYLYERDGTNCENLPETHAFLQELRRHVDAHYPDRMLLAEANQWPEDAVAYFGDGHECHMAFHFPLMPRLFMASRLEDRYPIVEILQQTPAIPESAQWAIFLRNHDELTLEMVTDEERDYMYRVYANDRQMRINVGIRRRLAPLLGNNRRKIELVNGLLLSLPGTPVIYYGDELGMGDNVYLGDRNGVRTPMQWSADRNAGFSRANPQQLYLPITLDPEYHYETVNVEAQQQNPSSLLWWMKRLLALRKRTPALSRGALEFLAPENRKVLAFLRRSEDHTVLVVANLSRFTQCAELDLSALKTYVPVELFGHTTFPAIGELPYFITLGPHTFYWFTLEPQQRVSAPRAAGDAQELPLLEVRDDWMEVCEPSRARHALEALLPAYCSAQRWFGGKAHAVRAARIEDVVRLNEDVALAIVQIEYRDAEPERYLLPLTCQPAAGEPPRTALARIRSLASTEIPARWLCEAITDMRLWRALLQAISRRRGWKGLGGELVSLPTRALRVALNADGTMPEPALLGAEQSNTSVRFGQQLILKLFRKLEEGSNPDVEIGRFLTERGAYAHVPPLAGTIEYRVPRHEPVHLCVLQHFMPNEGDAWSYTLDVLNEYYERLLAQPPAARDELGVEQSLLTLAGGQLPALAEELIGPYLQLAALLGTRTAQLHLALATERAEAAFAPEPFTALDQRALYQTLRSLASNAVHLLRQQEPSLPEPTRALASTILGREPEILARFDMLRRLKLTAQRIRVHGDYHLGQVLFTGKDVVIIDFEGEPAHTLTERRRKRSALRDVAGMIRSFHYAAYMALLGDGKQRATNTPIHVVRPEDHARLEPWALYWYVWVSVSFLSAYLAAAPGSVFLPGNPKELRVLLDVFLLEKAMYELRYELNHRPDWLMIPCRGIVQVLRDTEPVPCG